MKKFNNSNEPEFKKGLTEEEINSPEFDPDEFAPAPEVSQHNIANESLENKRNALVFAFIVAMFALIIGLVGWGSVKSVASYEELKEKKEVLSVFPNCDRIEEYKADKEGFDVYAVFFKEKMAGFCVVGNCEGFGGNIKYLVAFNSDNKISKIKIADHNESRGLGSKIEKDSFLSQFYGVLIGNVGAKYDLISGATTSSKAVGEAVRAVLGLGLSTDSIAKELGFETITEEEIEEEIKKEEEEKAPSKDTSKDTSDTTKPSVDSFQGGSNVNTGSGDIDHEGIDDTTVYDTETTKNDEETTEPEETTAKPEDTTEKPEETTGVTPDDTTAPTEETTAPEDSTSADTTAEDTTVADTTVPVDDTTANNAVPADDVKED